VDRRTSHNDSNRRHYYAHLRSSEPLQRGYCSYCSRTVSVSKVTPTSLDAGKAGWLAGQGKGVRPPPRATALHYGLSVRTQHARTIGCCSQWRRQTPLLPRFPNPTRGFPNINWPSILEALSLASAPCGKANRHSYLPCITCPQPWYKAICPW
jgi:hypothetical protein